MKTEGMAGFSVFKKGEYLPQRLALNQQARKFDRVGELDRKSGAPGLGTTEWSMLHGSGGHGRI